jgi:hypothetical protein
VTVVFTPKDYEVIGEPEAGSGIEIEAYGTVIEGAVHGTSTYGKDYKFTVNGKGNLLKVTVQFGIGPETELFPMGGVYIIPGNKITGTVTVKATVLPVTIGSYELHWIPNSDGKNTMTITGLAGTAGSGALNIPSVVTLKGMDFIITSIGDNAFSGCTGLTSVSMPNVISIGDNAFSGCTGLGAVAIPYGITLGISPFPAATKIVWYDEGVNATAYIEDGNIMIEFLMGVGNEILGISAGTMPGGDDLTVTESGSAWKIGPSSSDEIFMTVVGGYELTASVTGNGKIQYKHVDDDDFIDLIDTAKVRLGEVIIRIIPDDYNAISSLTFNGKDMGTETEITVDGRTVIKVKFSPMEFMVKGVPETDGIEIMEGSSVISGTTYGKATYGIDYEFTVNSAGPVIVMVKIGSGDAFEVPLDNGKYTVEGSLLIDDMVITVTDVRLDAGDFVLNLKYVGSTTDVTVAGYYTGSADLNIPGTFEVNGVTYTVTGIGDNVFNGITGLSTMVLPDTLTHIGVNAFNGCVGLTTLVMPINVSFASNAFKGCVNVSEITLTGTGDGKSFSTEYIRTPWYVSTVPALTVTLDENITGIGDDTFNGCENLFSISLAGIMSIGNNAFNGCVGLTTLIMQADAEIGTDAFNGCVNVSDMTLKGTGTLKDFSSSYEDTPWYISTATELKVTLDENITGIGDSMFCGCENLTDINLGNITTFGADSFSGCVKLKTLDLTNAENIGNNAFYGCIGFETIVVYDFMVTGADIFYGCVNVSDLTIISSGSTSMGTFNPTTAADTLWGISTADALKITLIGITEIGDYTFYGCENLVSIDIEDVTTIGNNAFSGCVGLTTIKMQMKATISASAFYGCTAVSDVTLTGTGTRDFGSIYSSMPWYISTADELKVTLSEGITGIGSSMFNGCENLVSITMPGVTTIDSYAFRNCSKLKGINSADGMTADLTGITVIGLNTFQNCVALTTVYMPDVMMNGFDPGLSSEAFPGCIGLTTITMHVSVVGTNAFSGCTGLSYVTLIGSGVIANFTNTTYVNAPWGSSTAAELTVVLGDEITSIGDYLFYNRSNLVSITMPGVTSIGTSAFYGCTGLSVLNMPLVDTIGTDAFYDCTGLTAVTMQIAVAASGSFGGSTGVSDITLTGDGSEWNMDLDNYQRTLWYASEVVALTITLDDNVTAVGDYAFYRCRNLVSIIMPGVTSIGDSAFYICSKLEAVDLTKVEYISDSAFYGCSELEDAYMPLVKSISEDAFSGCYGLTSVYMPLAEAIGDRAFSGCSGLTSVDMPSVTIIGDYAFYVCSGLISVVMPLAEEIGEYAFFECTSLTVVDMPSVTVIGDSAFSGCIELTEIIMPSVTTIGNNVFADCLKINSITISPDNEIFFVEDNAFASKADKRLIMFLGRDLTTYTVPDSIEIIGGYAFQNCTNLVSVNMTSVLTIEGYAFAGCTGLTTIETSAETIGNNAFYDCTGLTSVSMPDATEIGAGAFAGTNLLQVFMPSVTTIGNNAFYGCAGLSTVDLSNVETIGNNAFRNCIGLTSVSMPAATTIGSNAFADCKNLLQVSMPSAVTIRDFAFSGCVGLTTMNMPLTVTVGWGAFSGCIGLTTVNMPSAVTIGDYAFFSCVGLTLVTMPNVTDIKQCAFLDSGLKAITVKNVVVNIASDALPAGTKIVKYSGDAVSVTAYDVVGNDVMVMILAESGYYISSVTGTSGGGPITPTEIGDAWKIPVTAGQTTSEIVITAASGGYEILFEIEGEGEISYFIDSTDPKPLLGDRIQVKSGSTVTIEAGDGANYVFHSWTFDGTGTVVGNTIVASAGGIVNVVFTPKTYDITGFASSGVTVTKEGGGTMIGTQTGAATLGQDIVFFVNGNGNPVKVTVQIGSSVPRELMLVNGEYTIPGITITDDVKINVAIVDTLAVGLSGGSVLTFIPNTDGENTLTVVSVTTMWMTYSEIPDVVFFGGAAFRFTQITADALVGCTQLTDMSIPATILVIHDGLFDDCTSLIGITVHANNPNYSSSGGVLFNKDRSELILFPMGKTGEYIIPSTVTTVAAGAFADCAGLTELTIPSSVTSIGEGAFKGCDGLTAIIVSADNPNYSSDEKALFDKDRTTLIRFTAVDDTEYTIPSTMAEISEYAFEGCTALNVLAIPYGTILGENAFSGRIIWYTGALNATAYVDSSDTKISFQMNTDRIIFNVIAGTTYGSDDISITLSSGVYIVSGSGETFVTVTEGYEISANITNDSKGKVQYKSVDDTVFKDLTGIVKVRNGATEIRIVPVNYHTFESLNFSGVDKTADTFTVSGSGVVNVTFLPKTFQVSGEPETSEIRIIDGTKTIQGTTYGVATYGINYTFTITATGPVTVTVKIGSETKSSTPISGIYTITGTNIIDDVVIMVTEYLVPAGADFSVKVKYLTGTDVTVSGYAGTGSNAVIPGTFTYNGITYNVAEIGANAFKGCGIVSLAIPSTVTAIADSAFADCNALVAITATGNANFVVDGNVLFDTAKERIIRYMDRSAAHYTIPSTVDTIGGYAFQYSVLTSVTIHSGVTAISDGAFVDCSGLNAIAVPQSASYRWHLAFDGKDLVIYSGDTTDVTAGMSGTDVTLKINVTDGKIIREITLGTSSGADNAVRKENGDSVSFAIPDGTLYLAVTDVVKYEISANITGNGKVQYKMERDTEFKDLTSPTYVGGDVKIKIVPDDYHKTSSLKFGTTDKDGTDFDITDATVVNVTFIPVPYVVSGVPGSETAIEDDDGIILAGMTYGEAEYGADYKFTVDSPFLVYVTVKIGSGRTTELLKGPDGMYTIPGESIIGNVVITAVVFKVAAGDFELKVSVSGKDATVRGYTSDGETLEIPETFVFGGSEYTVKTIGAAAFSDCLWVTSLAIPNSVTSIGNSAFKGCSGLTTLVMPLNVSFGTDSFAGCVRIDDITLTGAGKDFSAGEYVQTPWYISYAELTVTLDPSITSVGMNTFRGCVNIKSITMPGVTNISNNAFNGCTGLTEIDISNVTSIGTDAFLNCTGLEKVTMRLNAAGTNAFGGCVNIFEFVLIGSGEGKDFSAAEYARAPWNISRVPFIITLDESITSIGDNTFFECEKLRSINLGKIVSIGDNAFYGCVALTTVNIPLVETIGAGAFQGCTALSKVEALKVTEIGDDAFYGCIKLSTVNMPRLEIVGAGAFQGCTTLPSIDLSKVISIGGNAFSGCTGITSVTISTSLVTLGLNVFQGCTGLEVIAIPEGFNIGSYSGKIIEYSGDVVSVNATMNGTFVTLIITVPSGTEIGNVSVKRGNDASIPTGGTNNIRTFDFSMADKTVYLNVASSQEVTVVQSGTGGTLKYSVGSGQSTAIPSGGKIPKGTETVSLIAEPSAGYAVTWTIDPSTAGTVNGNTVTVTAACTVTATFTLLKYEVKAYSDSGIDVMETEDKVITETVTGEVSYGSSYTFWIESSSAVYVTVKIGSGPAVEVFTSNEGKYVIENVTGNVEIRAVKAYSVTFTEGNGTITYQRSVDDEPQLYGGSFTGPAGTKLIIIPSPDSGYLLSYPAGGSPAGDGKVTFSNATGSIHLEFIQTLAVTVNITGTNGTVKYTVDGGNEITITDAVKVIPFNDGQSVTVTAYPSPNYVVSITVNNEPVTGYYVVLDETCAVGILFSAVTYVVAGSPGTGTEIKKDGETISGAQGIATYNEDYVFDVTYSGIGVKVEWKISDDSTFTVLIPNVNGQYVIPAQDVKGNITIRTANVYSVTLGGTEVSRVGTGNAVHGEGITVTMKANTHYDLPGTISVSVGGETVTGCTYNKTAGTVLIPGILVNGAIVITVNCEPREYTVTLPSSMVGYTLTDANGDALSDKAAYGSDYIVKVILNEGYTLSGSVGIGTEPAGITVLKTQGTNEFKIKGFNDDFAFSVTGVVLNEYGVTYQKDVEKYDILASPKATHGTSYVAVVTIMPGYDGTDVDLDVTGTGPAVRNKLSDNSYEFTISDVTGAFSFSVTGVVENSEGLIIKRGEGYTASAPDTVTSEYVVTVVIHTGYNGSAMDLNITGNGSVSGSPSINGNTYKFTVNGYTEGSDFTVIGVVPDEYTVTLPSSLSGYTLTDADGNTLSNKASFNSDYIVKVVLGEGYTNSVPSIYVPNLNLTNMGNIGNVWTFKITGFTGDFAFSVTGVALNQYAVTVNTDANGTVSGSGIYVHGSEQTISATPDTGYKFVSWNDNDTNAVRTIIVNGTVTYTATFVKISSGTATLDDIMTGSAINATKLKALLADSDDGLVITVPAGTDVSTLTIPNSVFADGSVAGKILEIAVEGTGGKTLYKWTFNGDGTYNTGSTNVNVNVIMSINTTDVSGMKAAVDKYIGDKNRMNEVIYLKFSAAGALPYNTTITYNVGTAFAGKTFELFYYNETLGKLDNKSQTCTVNAEGFIVFTIDHCSSYALISAAPAPSGESDDSGGDGGSSAMIFVAIAAVIAVVALIAVYFLVIKKKV